MTDSRNQLSILTITLHWLIALAMIGMIVFGLSLEDMPPSVQKWQLVAIHASIGIIVLVFAAWRLMRRIQIGFFEELGTDRPYLRKLAFAAHAFLLLATILMPISGIAGNIASAHPVEVFGVTILPQLLAQENKLFEEIAGATHGILANILILVVALHVFGALVHQFFFRDGTLTRIFGMRITD